MDTSETYIKMRLGARCDLFDGTPPLLPTARDPLWVAPTVFVDDKGDFYFTDKADHCQLERQDQLQEMVEFALDEPMFKIEKFTLFLSELIIDKKRGQFTSMEQLWLAFVMKEKYNKVWSGIEWIGKK